MRKMVYMLCLTVLMAALLCACGCGHKNTHLENVVEATCTQEGYSGDEICDDCGKTVKQGEALAKAEHTIETLYAREATCTEDGYSGEEWCTVCGAKLDGGHTVAALGHDWSKPEITKEATCTEEGEKSAVCQRCGETDFVEEIPRTPHDFVDNVCTVCGWRVPGEYENGQLKYTWQELIDQGLVIVDRLTDEEMETGEVYRTRKVHGVSEALSGLLVVEEGFALDLSDKSTVMLTGIWTPVTMKGFDGSYHKVFKDLPCVKEVRLFACDGLAAKYSEGQFQDCPSLETVILPEGTSYLGENCFAGCVSLKQISLPESVYWIGQSAFCGCASLERIDMKGATYIGPSAFERCVALREIDLPEGLEEIDSNAFARTGLTRVRIPESVTSLGSWAFFSCESLEEAELHGAIDLESMHALGKVYTGASDGNTFSLCSGLKKVTIGKDVTALPREIFTGCDSLTEIIYEASEDEWLDVAHKEWIPEGVTVTFTDEYTPGKAAFSKDIQVGETVTFGQYYQTDYDQGKEDIEWIVLANNGKRCTLISKYALNAIRYGDGISWEASTLRSWLNDNFLNEAFSEEEQELLKTVTLESPGKVGFDDYGGDTQDKVYVLSEAEAIDYFSSDADRMATPTAFALSNGVGVTEGATGCRWWLRRNNVYQRYMYVSEDGSMPTQGGRLNLGDASIGVRPVIQLSVN